jgi:phage gp29-like protein
MVGRGNEKFEVPSITSNNPSGAFDPLIERANSEMSKRILGGTGLTDEKGFVGSVLVQEKLAKDRFESDKLMVKNVINKKILPMLVKLSPVYSPLAGHYFEWDNAEIRTAKETAELLDILGNKYDVDPEWVEQQTGVPIIGLKSDRPAEPTAGADPKKKGFQADKKKSLK